MANVVDNWIRTIPEPGKCFISDFEGIRLLRMTERDLVIFHKWLNEVVGTNPKAFLTDQKRKYKYVVSKAWYKDWLAKRRENGF